MSRREKVDVKYIDTEYSSGDSKTMKSKRYQEENNNEVDELSKDLSEMGCIVGAVKRPSNICVETCVYESEDEKSESYNEEDAYSDEFEEDKSEGEEEEEEESVKTESKTVISEINEEIMTKSSSMKLSKSQSCMSSDKPASVSGRSTSFGSVSVPSTRRINMSFTNERLREIERHNHILLTKILSARNTRKSSIPPREQPPRRPVPSAAVSRKNQQRQIDHDNMILLKKIQRAKSSAYTVRR
ncbi:hemingway [Anticarsia gemmatalis]|uniref:hemingway n=1 Tax=Anticarsia gemmatalis TaxID=129554 RepID=UPI003F761B57